MREVSPFIDLPGFVKYLAVDNFIADYDGFLGFWGPNNFYVYRPQGRTDLVWFPWDKDLAFWAPHDDIVHNVEKNVVAHRAFEVPALRQLYLETLAACAQSAMAAASETDPTGWLEAEALREIAQFHEAGGHAPRASMSARSLRRPAARLLRMNSLRPMNGSSRDPHGAISRPAHASSHVTPLMALIA